MRRSTRQRVANKKYTVDAFAGLELEGVISAIDSSESEAAKDTQPQSGDSEEDEDFDVAAAEALEPAAEEDEESIVSNVSEGSSIATPQEDDSDVEYDELDGDEVGTHTLSITDRRTARYRSRKPGPLTHSRGVRELNRKEAKPQKTISLVGTDPDDAVPFLLARDKWVFGNILPSRKADKNGIGGMGYPPVHSAEKREEEATEGWDWYYEEGGREAFSEGQTTQALNAADAQPYRSDVAERPSYRILLGPYGSQQMFELGHNQSLNVVQAEDEAAKKPTKSSDQKAGWLLNISTPITWLEWAPNHGGRAQYLAVSTADKTPLDSSLPSAFAPGNASPSTIQIWEFTASMDKDGDGIMDPTEPPKLVHTICTDWGSVKHFWWCQVPRRFRETESDDYRSIGLLAAVFGDGLTRVLDIRVYDLGPNSSPYVKYSTAAFATRPPNTVCTCVTWLSSTEIAVGCANGFVAIFDITEHLLPLSDLDDTPESLPSALSSSWPTAFFYHSLHASYVLAISSTYPTSANFIATTSVDGHTRLTDIRAPYEDFVLAHRARVGQFSLDYHIATQSFLVCDDQDFTRMLNIRAFYSTTYIARSDGPVTCIAAGKCHATMIVGSADGGVLVTNPLPKLFNSKEKQRQVLWFKHEWASGRGNKTSGVSRDTFTDATKEGKDGPSEIPGEASLAKDTGAEKADSDETCPGLSRFTTSYLPTSYTYSGNIANGAMRPRGIGLGGGTKHPGNKSNAPQTKVGYTTVFEEKGGVTAVAWNPNAHVGGWAAAGMGSGLVRVENLAVDK